MEHIFCCVIFREAAPARRSESYLPKMKKTIYAILVMAAPLLAQCPNSLLPSGSPCINSLPTREFGQPTLINPAPNTAAPNLVIGQELFSPSGIAFDNSVSPPRVYVVDTGNNRVLGWANANSVGQANMADIVLGQPSSAAGGFDFTATLQWGPQTTYRAGLYIPTGIAVDAAGNVYVADSGNNRILRFATPFAQQPGNTVVDLVIGQSGIASTTANTNRDANQGQGPSSPSQTSLYLEIGDSNTQNILPAGLAIDTSGNLWAADPGNNRVLMFPAANLSANTSLPKATVALGQLNFTSNQLPSNRAQNLGSFLAGPTGVAVDSSGNVYVTDSVGRALVYGAPISLGQGAKSILGIAAPLVTGQSVPPYPSNYTLGSINSGGGLVDSPQGVFVLNNPGGSAQIFVCDSPQNRVVRYDSLTVPGNASSPVEGAVFGQTVYTSGQANQGGLPANQTLAYPIAGAIRPDNSEMWIVDQANHRVLAFTSQGGGVYNLASRVLGQKDYTHNGANLLEGREVWFNGMAGMVVDSTSCSAPGSPTITCSAAPHLYIADSQNNRILGFKDARLVGVDPRTLLTQTADIVIGQADGLSSVINYSPANPAGGGLGAPTATGLDRPIGLVVDSKGNLWVADSGNGRAVRFPAPFSVPAGTPQTADEVLGQASLTAFNPTVGQFTMVQPFGLAMFANGSLAVSDPTANRILVFNSTGGNFTNGEAASVVVGQTGFSQSATGSGATQLNSPRHIAVDSSDRLYVCDYNNNRLVVYSKPSANTPSAAANTTISQPEGIIVSFATGLSWIATGASVIQLPEFDELSQGAITQQLQSVTAPNLVSYAALAVALDPFDDVIVADNTNRVTFYFGQMFYRNTANYSAGLGSGTTAGPAPTMLAELHLLGNSFNFTPSYAASPANLPLPWSTTYSNGATTLQVMVNGIPAPIFRVDSPAVGDGGAVLIEIPNAAPSSGLTDFVISNPTTGQIYAVANLSMQQASPGIYTTNSQGTGQAAALSYDSKGNELGINSASVPVSPGGIIDLWLTGAGYIPNLPADGTAPGTATAFNTPVNPVVHINGQAAQVVGSAMSSQFPGVWQINAIVPASVAPSSVTQISVLVQMYDYPSSIGGTGTGTVPGADQALTVPNGLITTIYVK
jgi:uncharacterized protein (TIGR03437 family)